MIYFDNAATTKISAEVLEVMKPYLGEIYFNPSSVYSAASLGKNAIEKARFQVASALNAKAEEVYFTSCATESNNWAIRGSVAKYMRRGQGPCHIVTTQVEHPSVLNVVKQLEREGVQVTYLKVDEHGRINTEELESSIGENTQLVSVIFGNNEVGTLQPIAEAGEICRKKGILFHTDAVQAVGNVPIDVEASNISLLSLSGHKFHAPKGVGALYVKKGVALPNFLLGGGQERGCRGGTENLASIVGIGKAIEEATRDLATKNSHLRELRELLICGINEVPRVKFNGSLEHTLAGILNFSFEGIEGEGILLLLDSHEICCSSGSACTSGSLEPSHVLLAMGLDHGLAQSSLRISLSKYNTREEAKRFLSVLSPIVERLRQMSPIWNEA